MFSAEDLMAFTNQSPWWSFVRTREARITNNNNNEQFFEIKTLDIDGISGAICLNSVAMFKTILSLEITINRSRGRLHTKHRTVLTPSGRVRPLSSFDVLLPGYAETALGRLRVYYVFGNGHAIGLLAKRRTALVSAIRQLASENRNICGLWADFHHLIVSNNANNANRLFSPLPPGIVT